MSIMMIRAVPLYAGMACTQFSPVCLSSIGEVHMHVTSPICMSVLSLTSSPCTSYAPLLDRNLKSGMNKIWLFLLYGPRKMTT